MREALELTESACPQKRDLSILSQFLLDLGMYAYSTAYILFMPVAAAVRAGFGN
jgi:hypothetical protein